MDKEFFNLNEFQQGEEFVNFKAEDYKLKEHIKQNMEDFKVEEFSGSSLNNSDHESNENSLDDLKDKLNQTSSGSSGPSSSGASAATTAGHSVAAGVSVGSIGAIAVTAVAGTSIITGNNILNPEPSTPEPPAIVLPVYGDLEYNNSLIQYHEDDQGNTYQNIIFYMNGSLNEGFKAEIESETIKRSAPLVDNKVEFNNLPQEETNFTLNFFDKEDKLLDSREVVVPNNNVYSYDHVINDNYLITANSDGTINLYSQFESSYDGVFYNNPLVNMVDVTPYSEFKPIIKEGYSYIEDIPFSDLTVKTRPYLFKDNNYYTYGIDNFEEMFFDLDEAYIETNVIDDMLAIATFEEFKNSINVNVTFDDGSVQNIKITKDMLDKFGTCKVKLNKLSPNLELDITIDKLLPNTFESDTILKPELENVIKGSNHKLFTIHQSVTPTFTDKLDLDYVVMADEYYLNDETMLYQDYSPIILYFKGRLKDSATYYMIEAIDETGVILPEHQNDEFSELNQGVLFKTTKLNKTYTFKYYLKDNYNKQFVGEVTYKMGEKPANLGYGDGSLGVYPHGCYITYNNDNTYNIYNHVDFYNPDEEDMYALFNLYDINDFTKPIDTFITNQDWSKLDIPITQQLAVHALILIKRGNVYYAATRAYTDNNQIGPNLINGVMEINEVNVTLDSATNEVTVTYDPGIITSDVTLTYQVEGETPKTITINLEDMAIDNVDMYTSSFKFILKTTKTNVNKFNLDIKGNMKANDPYMTDEYINRLNTVTKGNDFAPFVTQYIYNATL